VVDRLSFDPVAFIEGRAVCSTDGTRRMSDLGSVGYESGLWVGTHSNTSELVSHRRVRAPCFDIAFLRGGPWGLRVRADPLQQSAVSSSSINSNNNNSGSGNSAQP